MTAYMTGLSVAVLLLIIAAMISTVISYRPDKSDVSVRKTWFWVFAILTPVLTFGLSYFLFYGDIKGHTKQEEFMTAMCIASGVAFVLYLVLGFICAKVSKTGKLSNWF